jgi:glutamate synthase (NADPH) large chain
MPRDYARVLIAIERAEREGLPVDEVVMEAING